MRSQLLARLQSARDWLAAQLQVRPQAGARAWLLGLLLLPAAQRVHPGSALRALLLGLARGTYRVLDILVRSLMEVVYAALWPLERAMAALDRLARHPGFVTWGRRTDAVLGPLLAWRGMQAVMLGGIGMLALVVLTTPFSALGQLLFMVLCWCVSMVLRRLPGRYPSLALACMCLITLGRYVWWRCSTTLNFDSGVEAALGYGLLAAEAYTWLMVVLSFVQTAWPLQRHAVPLAGTERDWPSVDVFIPTYNEGLSVVQPTVLAALAMDWPSDKLRVYLLDDGRRPALRAFAESVGAHYLDRPDNRHAKAGNLNHALGKTDGELVAIFDCDHIPTRQFLKTCVGWFQREPRCALVQTPHHFFSPDPFERNLGTFRRVPNEGALFYGLIQDGNDLWNSAFFCGSCAVLRRGPLMEIGGIAVETVTEDAHTALKLHRRGYQSAYINQTLAAGLATESLSAHVGQRIRWARGMAQIFRLDNPLLGPGLTLWQRLCYVTSMLHFFFGLPRLVFLTAPMAYLFFQWHIIDAPALMLALYVVPYILLSNIANAHLQGESRHTFWADVYETVLAAYLTLPTAKALIQPHAGGFNVTAKGGLVQKPYFDWTISQPYSVLVALNLAAFISGWLRLFYFNTHEPGTVLLNMVWTVYSLLILGAALGVASETRQVRRSHRVQTRLDAVLYLMDGRAVHCRCVDFSMSGLGLQMPPELAIAPGARVQVGLWADGRECSFEATVLLAQGGNLGLQLLDLDYAQSQQLVQCTFARPDAWLDWTDTHDADRPLQGLQEIALLGLSTYGRLTLVLGDRLHRMLRILVRRRKPVRP